jgi:hypothetical protein
VTKHQQWSEPHEPERFEPIQELPLSACAACGERESGGGHATQQDGALRSKVIPLPGVPDVRFEKLEAHSSRNRPDDIRRCRVS